MKKGIQVLDPSELLAKGRVKKRRGSEAAPSARREQPAAPTGDLTPPHGVGSSQSMSEELDKVFLSFPGNVSLYSDSLGMLDSYSSFLFPEDQSRLESLGVGAAADWAASRTMQAMCGTLFLRNTIRSQEKRIHDLQTTNAALCKQSASAADKEKEWRDKYQTIATEHQACVPQIQALTKQLESMAMQASLKTRAVLMAQFKAGKASEWDPDEAIELWKDLEAEIAAEQEEDAV